MKKIVIAPATEFYIGRNILEKLEEVCGKLRPVLVVDAAIKDLDAVKKIQAEMIAIPNAKNQEVATYLIGELFKMGAGRDTVLIAMGGGATTDLVGFVASIYMRGIPLIFIPTTLLSMVDAAIGGKTSIDTPLGKNLIGTNYFPKAIFADLDLLQTLPEKEWRNGMAEILKMGLIYDATIWKQPDGDLFLKAIEGKIAIVEQDPKEQGLRRILNFGHTIGHALETAVCYGISHGEAVVIGCVTEAHLSMRLGYLSEKEFEEILGRYNHFQLPKGYSRLKLLSAMSRDKKKASGQIRFVLIDAIGHAMAFDGAYCRNITLNELEPTLEWMENWKSSP